MESSSAGSPIAWHGGLSIAFMFLTGTCCVAAWYVNKVKKCFSEKVYHMRQFLLISLGVFGVIRCTQLMLGVLTFETNDILTPTHVSNTNIAISFLFVGGYWDFFTLKMYVVLVWLQSCSRQRGVRMHHRRLLLLCISSFLLGVALLVMVGLYKTELYIAFAGMNMIILVSSVVASVGFTVAGIALNLSINAVNWRAQLSRAARRALHVARTLAVICIVSFTLRAALNAAYYVDSGLYVSHGVVYSTLHVLEYLIELGPAFALVVNVASTSYQQQLLMGQVGMVGLPGQAPPMAMDRSLLHEGSNSGVELTQDHA